MQFSFLTPAVRRQGRDSPSGCGLSRAGSGAGNELARSSSHAEHINHLEKSKGVET